MIDTIIEIPATIWTKENPQPSQSVLMAEYLDKQAYLTTTPDEFTGTILGAWDSETGLQEGQTYNDLGDIVGTPTHPIQPNYLTYVRPLGNMEGVATGVLDSLRFQGHVEPKYVEEDKRYPSTNMPFSLQIERQIILDDGFPHIPNGWKVTMISDDPERDITARGIGIYDSDWIYLYTTGSFIADGDTYSTTCPVGQRTEDEQQINFKLMLGSAPEGAWTLTVGKEDDTRQFWKEDQGEVPTPAIDLDGDGYPDTEVLYPGSHMQGAPRITVDENSVNIDIDGDGDIDMLIPLPEKS